MLRIISPSVPKIFLVLLAAGLLTPMPALAQTEPAGPITVSGGINVVSDYRFRGVSRTDGDFAVQPYLNIDHVDGFYGGFWASNIKDQPVTGEVELNLYAGYVTEIASGTNLDLGLTRYWHVDGNDAAGSSDYFELSGKLSHMLGPIEGTGTLAYSWDQAALNGDRLYLNAGLSAGVPNTPITIKAGVGYTDGQANFYTPVRKYWDWSLGASAVFGPITAGVRYVDTDISKTGVAVVDKRSNAGLIFSMGYFF